MFDDARERARDRNPMLAISAIAWGVILLDPGGIFGPMHGGAAHAAHVTPGLPVVSMAAGWIVMLVAMMTPALIAPVRHIRLRSFTHRRLRAIALFAAAYATIWIAAGAVLIALARALITLLAPHSYLPIAGVLLVAFAWQCSPAKQVCLNRCHRHTELPAFGREADLGVLRFGVTHGLWCAGACWAVMLTSLVLPQGHIAMAGATVLIVSERFDRPRPPSWRVRGGRTLLRAGLFRMSGGGIFLTHLERLTESARGHLRGGSGCVR